VLAREAQSRARQADAGAQEAARSRIIILDLRFLPPAIAARYRALRCVVALQAGNPARLAELVPFA
jgi:hypothetical protein